MRLLRLLCHYIGLADHPEPWSGPTGAYYISDKEATCAYLLQVRVSFRRRGWTDLREVLGTTMTATIAGRYFMVAHNYAEEIAGLRTVRTRPRLDRFRVLFRRVSEDPTIEDSEGRTRGRLWVSSERPLRGYRERFQEITNQTSSLGSLELSLTAQASQSLLSADRRDDRDRQSIEVMTIERGPRMVTFFLLSGVPNNRHSATSSCVLEGSSHQPENFINRIRPRRLTHILRSKHSIALRPMAIPSTSRFAGRMNSALRKEGEVPPPGVEGFHGGRKGPFRRTERRIADGTEGRHPFRGVGGYRNPARVGGEAAELLGGPVRERLVVVRRKGVQPQLQPVIKIQNEGAHGWQSNGITRGFKDQSRRGGFTAGCHSRIMRHRGGRAGLRWPNQDFNQSSSIRPGTLEDSSESWLARILQAETTYPSSSSAAPGDAIGVGGAAVVWRLDQMADLRFLEPV